MINKLLKNIPIENNNNIYMYLFICWLNFYIAFQKNLLCGWLTIGILAVVLLLWRVAGGT